MLQTEKATTGSAEQGAHLVPALVWGANGEWKLQFGGENRTRAESRDNFDMNKAVGDNDNLAFVLSRLNLDLVHRSVFRAFVEVLDARMVDNRVDYKQEAYLHLHQLLVDLRCSDDSPWTLRLGRQEMNFGSKRLVESSRWSNLPQTWEGARLMYRTAEVDVDAFLLQADLYNRHHKPEDTTDAQHPKNHEWFYGIFSTLRWWSPHLFDVYYMGLSDRENERVFPSTVKSEEGRFGTTDRHTVGARMYGPLWKRDGCGTLAYDLESAFQFGHKSNDDIRAGMAHADVSYQWDRPWKPKLTVLGNVASGDRKNGDGVSNTFSPLYGSTHSPYGIIDFLRLQNMRELALTGSITPTKKLELILELHQFWLDSRTDSWYLANGSSFAQDKTGQSGRDLGQEVDLIAKYKVSKRTDLEAGAARFIPGNFAEKNGRPDAANYLYLQYRWTF
jgi:hypothetical protein